MFLVKYGEVSLKSKRVRQQFVNALVGDIKRKMVRWGVEGRVEVEWGALRIYTENPVGVENVLRHTFGVVSYAWAVESTSNPRDMEKIAVSLAGDWEGSFAVRCKRSGTHPYTSQEMAAFLGEKILDSNPRLRVDLRSPENILWVEIRGGRSYFYTEKKEGPGGLPLGTEGRVLLIPDGSVEDTVLAGWFLMRRGANVHIWGGESGGVSSSESGSKVDAGSGVSPKDVFAALEKWGARGVISDDCSGGGLVGVVKNKRFNGVAYPARLGAVKEQKRMWVDLWKGGGPWVAVLFPLAGLPAVVEEKAREWIWEKGPRRSVSGQ